MKSRSFFTTSGLLAGGCLIGCLFSSLATRDFAPRAEAAQADAKPADELAALRAQVAKLEAGQSLASAMRDVDYHAQSLWFAGRAGNWPLANYYWQATQSHMRLAADRPAPGGTAPDANLQAIQRSIESTPSMQVGNAIEKRDVVSFQTHYRSMLEGCYACHKAAGKPFLRPRMPVKPHQAMINVDPNATWPQ